MGAFMLWQCNVLGIGDVGIVSQQPMLGDWMGCQQQLMVILMVKWHVQAWDGRWYLFSHKPRCVRESWPKQAAKMWFPKNHQKLVMSFLLIHIYHIWYRWYRKKRVTLSRLPGGSLHPRGIPRSLGNRGRPGGGSWQQALPWLDGHRFYPARRKNRWGGTKKITGFLGSWTWQLDFIMWAVFKTPVGWWLYRELYYPIYWGFWTPLMCF